MAIPLTISFPVLMYLILSVPLLFLNSGVPLPTIDNQEWWGPSALKNNISTAKRTFTVNFSDAVIQRIRSGIANMPSVTPSLQGSGFEYGMNSDQLLDFVDYWHDNYNFSARQNYFNQFPQYVMNVQGVDIHWVEVTPQASSNVEQVPLLMLHGYPGSVREYYETFQYLTAISSDRNFSVKVIAASLVGSGFSGKAARPGCGVDKVAIIFRNFMQQLGYSKYYVHGNHIGALIAKDMATFYPTELLGLIVKLPFLITPRNLMATFISFTFPPQFSYDYNLQNDPPDVPKSFSNLLLGTGFLHELATKPDTIGLVTANSVAGAMACILGDFVYNDTLENIWTKDQLLDIVMTYVTTNTLGYAGRLYAETFATRYFNLQLDQISTPVPTVSTSTSGELTDIPLRAIQAKFPNTLSHTTIENVTPFVAFQTPKPFSDNVIQGIGQIRQWHINNPTA